MNIIELLTILQALSLSMRVPKCKHDLATSIELRTRRKGASKWELLNEDMCGSSLADRIIGGVNASLGQFPWIASLGYTPPDDLLAEPTFRCGATLINRCFVVTAGHCIPRSPTDNVITVIRLGEHNMMTEIDCVADECADRPVNLKPRNIYLHPQYGQPVSTENDIALIQLERSVIYTKWIRPICMPYGDLLHKDYVGESGDVAGWGIADLSESVGSNILQTVKLPVIKIQACKKHYRRSIIYVKNKLCAGGIIGKDSCSGDSGGPLMKVEAINGPPRYFLIGIVSFGSKLCAQSTLPAVYSRISSFMPWILETITEC